MSAMPSFRGICIACLTVLAAGLSSQVSAQTPTITSTVPMAVQPGSTLDVKIRGGNLVGATELWTSFPCKSVLSPDVKDNGKNAAEVTFRLTVPADVPVGVNAIRVATPGGTSALKLFLVDDIPSLAQKGGNTTPANAQELTLPIAVDGSIPSLAHGYYKFQAAAGQVISIEVLARRIGSALDPMIRLLDSKGRELSYSDDVPGLRADSQLCYKFETVGEYVLEVRDIRYQGGANHYYRLRIGDFPCVTTPYPMGVKRGSGATVAFAGAHIDNIAPTKVNVPADAPFDWINVGAKRVGGKTSGLATLAISNSEEFVEKEPNDDAKQSNRVQLGASVNGRFEKPGDVDRYVFTAKKGQKFTFTGITRRQGAPTSLIMRLLKADGGQVAIKDDFGVTDSVIAYAFPADGDYTLLVQDLHRRGGSSFAYRVTAAATQTGFVLNASANSLNIAAGGTAFVTVTSVRKGYNGAIAVAAVDLPKGITSSPTVIGPGLNTVVLTLQSAADAPVGKVNPIRIVGTAKIGESDFQTTASIETALKAALNAVPWPPTTLTESVAVGVGPKAQISLRTEPAQLVFGRDLKATVKIIAARQKGFDGAIAFVLNPAKGGLPAGITAAVKPIPKAKNEIEIVFSATNKAPLGEFTAVLNGTIKQGKTTVVQATPGIGLKLQAPYTLKAAPAATKLARGGKLKVKVTVERNPAFKAAIALTFDKLPKGVTAAAASIPADKNEVEIELSAAQDAVQGAAAGVTVKGDATVGKAKLAGVSPAVTFTVE